jgi:hypothetical protein
MLIRLRFKKKRKKKKSAIETHKIAILQAHKLGLALVFVDIVVVGEDAFAVYDTLRKALVVLVGDAIWVAE